MSPDGGRVTRRRMCTQRNVGQPWRAQGPRPAAAKTGPGDTAPSDIPRHAEASGPTRAWPGESRCRGSRRGPGTWGEHGGALGGQSLQPVERRGRDGGKGSEAALHTAGR